MHEMQLSAVDLNLLSVLHAVVQTRSVKLAAARLALSPSATSHALARLRELLGDPIVVRAGRSLVLTPRAERLRPQVTRILEDVGRLLAGDTTIDPAQLSRAFTVGTNDYGERVLLVELGHRLAREAPGVDLFAVRAPSFVEALRDGSHDLGLAAITSMPSDIEVESLVQERFVALLRRGHPAARSRLTLRRYAALEHVLVAPRGTPRGVVDQLLEAQGLRRRIARTVATFGVAPYVVADSDYVVTLAERIARPLAAQLDLVVCPCPKEIPTFEISMAWHRRHDGDPAHAWFRQQLREVADM